MVSEYGQSILSPAYKRSSMNERERLTASGAWELGHSENAVVARDGLPSDIGVPSRCPVLSFRRAGIKGRALIDGSGLNGADSHDLVVGCTRCTTRIGCGMNV